MKLWVAIPVVTGLAFSIGIGSATSITVLNPSFELTPTGGFTSTCGTGCQYNTNNSIPDWTVTNTSGFSGEWQPGSSSGDTNFFNSVPDGLTIAYSNGGTIDQNVATISQAGLVYTLTVDIGLRKDTANGPTLGSAELLVNGIAVSTATGLTPTPGNFSLFTATYTSTAADIGKTLTIGLVASGPQGEFDNVALNASAVPEPTTIALMGFGLLGLGIAAKRKRNS